MHFKVLSDSVDLRGRRDRTVVGFMITHAVRVYHPNVVSSNPTRYNIM